MSNISNSDKNKTRGRRETQQNIQLGIKSLENIVSGISYIVNFVSTTYGAQGKNILIKLENGEIISTNDGVTVINNIKSHNADNDIGIELIKQVSKRTDEEAGDGTTLTALLSKSLIDTIFPTLARHQINYLSLLKAIKTIKQTILDELERRSYKLTTQKEIRDIANVATNNEEYGKLIGKAFNHIGKDGVVMVENSKSFNTRLVIEEGTKIDSGFVSPNFLSGDSNEISLDNVNILVTDFSINTQQDAVKLLQYASKNNKTILLFCNEIETAPMWTILVNKSYARIYIVKLPGFGEERQHVIEDIILKCGGQAILNTTNNSFNFNDGNFGSANKVKITRKQTIILEGRGNDELIKRKILKLQIEQKESDLSTHNSDIYRHSLNRLTGKIAVIKIGGSTMADIEETKLKLEDGIHSVKSASKHGYCEGGGKTLINLAKFLESSILQSKNSTFELKIAANLVIESLLFPIKIMCKNAVLNENVIIKTLLNISNDSRHIGIEFINGKKIDLLKNGIIDSTYAIKVAIINSFSVLELIIKHGGSIINTED